MNDNHTGQIGLMGILMAFMLAVGSAQGLVDFAVLSSEVNIEQPDLKLGFKQTGLVWLPNETVSDNVINDGETFSKNFESPLDWYPLEAELEVDSSVVNNISDVEFSADSKTCEIDVNSSVSSCSISSSTDTDSFSVKFNLSTSNITLDQNSLLRIKRGGG